MTPVCTSTLTLYVNPSCLAVMMKELAKVENLDFEHTYKLDGNSFDYQKTFNEKYVALNVNFLTYYKFLIALQK